jgi:hypothetical protein
MKTDIKEMERRIKAVKTNAWIASSNQRDKTLDDL